MIVYPGRAQWLPHTKCQDLTPPRWSKGEGESKIFRKHCHLINLNILGRKGSIKRNLLVFLALFVCLTYTIFLSFQDVETSHEEAMTVSSGTICHWVWHICCFFYFAKGMDSHQTHNPLSENLLSLSPVLFYRFP